MTETLPTSFLLKNARIYSAGNWYDWDVLVVGERIQSLAPWGEIEVPPGEITVYDLTGKVVTLGFVDIHVHLREPGLTHKEDVASGTMAARAGGYTHVIAMANTAPCMDDVATVAELTRLIEEKAVVNTYTYAAISTDLAGQELVDFPALAQQRIVKGFSDDGKGVQSEQMMRAAMLAARAVDLPIVAHCEDEAELVAGGVVDESDFAKKHHLGEINHASEANEVKRNIELAQEIGVQLHLCHISTAESVTAIREKVAVKNRTHISAETGPHYLLLTRENVDPDNANFKMNPPLRGQVDQDALIEALNDGTIQVIATDHAPHAASEKELPFAQAPFGIIGTQHAFPLLYTYLVKTGKVKLETVLAALIENPARIMNFVDHQMVEGAPANLTILDLATAPYQIETENFAGKSQNSPFIGWNCEAAILATIVNGQLTNFNL